jgi:sulfatase maturation enzyme AslB (radical SAM superfamily)
VIQVYSEKEYIKKRLLEFWLTHKGFDDRNYKHVKEAEEFFKDFNVFPREVIIEAIEELRDEAEIEFEKSREDFYKKIKEIRET